MIKRTAIVANAQGIHVRPSQVIATAAMDLPGNITISSGGFSIDQINTINIISLGLTAGDTVEITVDGRDEDKTAELLVKLFETRYDFPPRA